MNGFVLGNLKKEYSTRQITYGRGYWQRLISIHKNDIDRDSLCINNDIGRDSFICIFHINV